MSHTFTLLPGSPLLCPPTCHLFSTAIISRIPGPLLISSPRQPHAPHAGSRPTHQSPPGSPLLEPLHVQLPIWATPPTTFHQVPSDPVLPGKGLSTRNRTFVATPIPASYPSSTNTLFYPKPGAPQLGTEVKSTSSHSPREHSTGHGPEQEHREGRSAQSMNKGFLEDTPGAEWGLAAHRCHRQVSSWERKGADADLEGWASLAVGI